LIRRFAAQLAAAVLVTAAATLVLPATPAQAAYCSSGSGVSVLVDYGALGGGTATGCGSGTVASAAFNSAGFSLTPHPRQQGFVCKVQGKPANGDCLATDSYWGFFVSDDGKGWVYASQGVYQQAVDAGDSVALVWQSSASRRNPGTNPATVRPAPTKTATPTPKPTKRPTAQVKPKPTKHVDQPANPAVSPAATATASATPTRRPTTSPSAGASTTASATAMPSTASDLGNTPETLSATSSPATSPSSEVATDATEPAASDSGGLPGWVPPVLVAALALAAGGVAWARRSR
jgi:hypothetical protein